MSQAARVCHVRAARPRPDRDDTEASLSDDHPFRGDSLDALGDDALVEINRLWTIARAVSNAAHAVNNALQVIGGAAEMLESRADADPATVRRAQVIRAHAARAAALLEVLVSYSRERAATVQPVDLVRLASAALEMRMHALRRAGIGAEMHGAAAVSVHVQPSDLLQLLLNVLLLLESGLIGIPDAAIEVRVVERDSEARIDLVGRAGGSHRGPTAIEPVPLAPPRLLRCLASRLGATIEMPDGEALSFSLVLPASPRAGGW